MKIGKHNEYIFFKKASQDNIVEVMINWNDLVWSFSLRMSKEIVFSVRELGDFQALKVFLLGK